MNHRWLFVLVPMAAAAALAATCTVWSTTRAAGLTSFTATACLALLQLAMNVHLEALRRTLRRGQR